MAIHRATTMCHSAAEARIRNDAHSVNHWNSVDLSSDISSDPGAPPTHNPDRRPSLSISLDYSHRKQKQASLQLPPSTNPTQPLLPTTRYHAQLSSELETSNQPPDIEHIGYQPMPIVKSSSGTYIGLLCIALIWLLPIGIIATGGTGGEVEAVAQAPVSLFGRPAQVPVGQSKTSMLRPFIWEHVKRAEHCLRYKTREYVARSIGGGKGQAGLEECEQTPAQIHDVELRPSFCEDLGLWGGIWGHWVVDFGEVECETSWSDFQDEGCQSSNGLHRFTATLNRFNHSDDWLIMCSTTPPEYLFHGKRLPVPTGCQRVKDVVQGTWDIPDRSCTAASVAPS